MPTVNDFYNLSLAATRGDAQMALTANGAGVTTRTGRSARWIGNLRTSGNRRTIDSFVQSLRTRYGTDVAHRLVNSYALDRSAQSGKPLRARQVRQIVNSARDMTTLRPIAEQRVSPAARPGVNPKLARELRRALNGGLVNQFVLAGDPACPYPQGQRSFTQMLRRFNDTMEILHRQFPKLRDVRPPNLSQNALQVKAPCHLAEYENASSTISFCSQNTVNWRQAALASWATSLDAPKAPAFAGSILHEYGHHLASEDHSDQPRWLTALAVMLTENGFIHEVSQINTTCDIDPSFAEHVGNKTTEMGLGTYAGTTAAEFAAEVLAWRMSPGYGTAPELPRMPNYLEAWVHECFPFTRDGPIPVPWVEIVPARR